METKNTKNLVLVAPLLSSFATGLTSSRDSSSIMARELVSVDSDDEDVEYKGDLGIPDVDDCATGSFCSSCAIPPRIRTVCIRTVWIKNCL